MGFLIIDPVPDRWGAGLGVNPLGGLGRDLGIAFGLTPDARALCRSLPASDISK